MTEYTITVELPAITLHANNDGIAAAKAWRVVEERWGADVAAVANISIHDRKELEAS